MGTIREEANAYQQKEFGQIADLDKINIDDIQLATDQASDQEGKTYEYQYFVLNDIRYRMPQSVKGYIKNIIKKKPDVKYVTVMKSGEGKQTKYQVMPTE